MGKDHRWHASSEEDQSNCGTDRVGNLNPKPARRVDGGAGNAQAVGKIEEGVSLLSDHNGRALKVSPLCDLWVEGKVQQGAQWADVVPTPDQLWTPHATPPNLQHKVLGLMRRKPKEAQHDGPWDGRLRDRNGVAKASKHILQRWKQHKWTSGTQP